MNCIGQYTSPQGEEVYWARTFQKRQALTRLKVTAHDKRACELLFVGIACRDVGMLILPSTPWRGLRVPMDAPTDSFKMTMKIKNFKNLPDIIRNFQIKNKDILFDVIEKSQEKIHLFLPLREKKVYCTWAKSLNGQSDNSYAKTSIVDKSFSLRIRDARCLVIPQGIINQLRISDISHWFSFDKVCLSNPALSQSDPQANIGFLMRTDSQKIYQNTQLVIKSADEHQQDLYNCLTNLFLHNEQVKSVIAGGDYPDMSSQERTSPFIYSSFYFLADGDEEQCSEFFSRNINIRNPFECEVGLEDVFIHQDDLKCLQLVPRYSFPLLGNDEIDTLEKQLVQAEKISNFVPAIRKAFVKCWIDKGSDYVFRANFPNPGKSKDANKITQKENGERGSGQGAAKLASSEREYGKIKMEETGLHKDMCSFLRNQLGCKGFEKQFTKLFTLIWSDSVKSQYYLLCENKNQNGDVDGLIKKADEGDMPYLLRAFFSTTYVILDYYSNFQNAKLHLSDALLYSGIVQPSYVDNALTAINPEWDRQIKSSAKRSKSFKKKRLAQ